MGLFDPFRGPPPLPGVSPDALILAAAFVVALVWRLKLPASMFPLKGKWLRWFLTGACVVAAVATCGALFHVGYVPAERAISACLPW